MIIFSIIGTLIGAGFASGQEMYQFFYKYGINGLLGIMVCSILMSIIIYKTFLIIYTKKINKYEDFLGEIFHSKKLNHISNIIVNIFLISTFYIMISGFGAYFEQQFHIQALFGSIIFAIICFFVLIKDIQGVKIVNSVIVPVLIVIIMTVGFLNMKNIAGLTKFGLRNNSKWILEAIVYCSYNMILVIPVLVNLGKYIKTKKDIIIISILSGGIVFLLAIAIFLLLASLKIDYSKIEMPAVFAINNCYSQFSTSYGIVILFSIFSTAISIGISFLKSIKKNKNSYPQIVVIMCISGVFISNFGFSNLVKLLFPIFGYIGIMQILFILMTKTKNKR